MTNQTQVTDADREAVTAFHKIMAQRILAGDKSLGDNRDTIEQAFANHRIQSTQSHQEEIARLREYAREVSKAFTAVSGGGSEMMTRIGDEFYADPKACRERVEAKSAAKSRFFIKQGERLSNEKSQHQEEIARLREGIGKIRRLSVAIIEAAGELHDHTAANNFACDIRDQIDQLTKTEEKGHG